MVISIIIILTIICSFSALLFVPVEGLAHSTYLLFKPLSYKGEPVRILMKKKLALTS